MRSRAESARSKGIALRSDLEAQRAEHDSVETAFCWIQRDKDIAGGVLGGGLAYRFFFWVLALTVLLAGDWGSPRPRGKTWPRTPATQA